MANYKYPPKPITIDTLRERVSYDPETGYFTRRVAANPRLPAGSRMEKKFTSGYMIRVKGIDIPLSRAAWWFVTGEKPNGYVVHKNGNKADARASNLELVQLAHHIEKDL
jgi:hypothetical protein